MNDALGPINLVVLALPGAALLWTARLVYGRRGTSSDDVLKRVLSTASWLMLLLAFFGVVGGMTGPFALLALPIVWIVFIMILGQYRRSENRALLDVLAIAAERGLPLDAAARAFADERADELGLRAGRLADALAAGTSLPEALESSGHRFLPIDAKLAVRVGWETGQLGPAIRRITGMNASVESMLRTTSVKFLYLFVLFFTAVGILSFVMLKIIPTFAKMFEEFELKLPPPTLLLVALSNKAVKLAPFLVPVLSLFFMVSLPAAALHYLGWLPRWLPFVSVLTLRYDGSLVMRTLALAVSQQRSLVEMIRLLAWHYPLSPVRLRLARAAAAIDHGIDWCDALMHTGLIRPADAAVLKAAQRVGNLEWALDEMADASLRRASYRWQAIANIVAPIFIVIAGMLVGFIVISLFMPLIALIQGLSK